MKFKVYYLVRGKKFMYEYVYSFYELYTIMANSVSKGFNIKIFLSAEFRLPLFLIRLIELFGKSK